ncbi:MAG TPA: hypothetical protein VGL38_13460 [bacterium]
MKKVEVVEVGEILSRIGFTFLLTHIELRFRKRIGQTCQRNVRMPGEEVLQWPDICAAFGIGLTVPEADHCRLGELDGQTALLGDINQVEVEVLFSCPARREFTGEGWQDKAQA